MFSVSHASVTDSESSVSTMDRSFSRCYIPRSQCTISPSVVLIGIFDKTKNSIINIATGFIADASRGFIITSSHILNLQPKKYKFILALHNDDEKLISYQYYGQVISTYMTACCLCLTHVIKSTIDIHRRHVAYKYHRSCTPLSPSTIRALGVIEPVTQMHLHQLFELCIAEALDIGQAVFTIGYNKHCEGPICLTSGRCSIPLDDMGKMQAPQHIVLTSKHVHHMVEELLGGPVICSNGRVIGISSRSEKNGIFQVTSAPVLEAALKVAQRWHDANVSW